MTPCPQCNALVTPGSSDCPKCGYLFGIVDAASTTPDHGAALGLFIMLGMAGAGFSILRIGHELFENLSAITGLGIVLVLIVLIGSTYRLIALIAIWQWKKWGVYTYFAVTAVLVLLEFLLTDSYLTILSGVIAIGILAFLISQKWEHFQ